MNLFGTNKKRRPGWLCLNLHADRVDLSHVLVAGKPRPEVLLCESFRKEGSDVDTLRRLRKELNLDRYRCTTLLKTSEYQTFAVDTPDVPAAEARNAVRWSLKDMIDYPVEAAMIDAVTVPGGNNAGRAQMLAVAARNEAIAATVQPFNDADIDLEVIDIPELAQRNVARLLEDDSRGLAMLCFDDAGAMLTFTCGGELYQARQIEVSQRDFALGAADVEARYDRVALELQRSLDNFDRQFRNVAVSRLIVSRVADGEGLIEYLGANLTVPVVMLDLGQVVDFPGVPELRDPLRQSQCLQLIGAAMREEHAV